MKVSDQVRVDTAPAQGRDTAQYVLREGGALPTAYMQESDWHFSDNALGSDWLCWAGSGFLQIKLGPVGGATDSGFLHRWPVSLYSLINKVIIILFYCRT